MTDWDKSSKTALARLSEKKPKTKAAQIRALYIDIESALTAGHSLKDVCETLAASGLVLTREQLGAYLTRERRRRTKTPVVPKPPQTTPAQTSATSAPAPAAQSDALSNLTARAKQTIEFKADVDPSELI